MFGVRETRKRPAVLTAAGAGLIGLAVPGALVVAGGIAAGLGGFTFADRRAVAKGLREVEAWGFPVEGYRAWLIADDPTFDIELAREVDLDVIRTSVRAIEPTCRVERTLPKVFRIVTRKVALPSPKRDEPAMLVGDRRLLHELHAQILAPLHADVGIVAMRMGDGSAFSSVDRRLALPSSTTTEGDSMGAFRDAAMAAPPALQALVHVGGTRELPREARGLRHRAERVLYAIHASPNGVGTAVGFAACGAVTGAGWLDFVGGPGVAIGAAAGLFCGAIAAIQANRRNARKIAASTQGHGFPIEGYDDWLISGLPLFDIELAGPADHGWLAEQLRALHAFSITTNTDVPWVEQITWLGSQLVRIETRPTLIEPPGRKVEPFYGGSHMMFQTLTRDVLVPLHARTGIKIVRMGGYIDRRV
ncbi:MAG: hypothetical protein AB7P03_22245 [Kofleriaceae bacterium]